jgi:DNA invertase Pin-like site-specific DNA recombinase
MFIGYARVSTTDQNPALQLDALKAAGCERVFTDKGMSGRTTERPGLAKAMKVLGPGDTLIMWKLDRLGRSLAHLVQTVADLGTRGIGFRSLSDPIDTTNAGGRLVLHMMVALAEFERSLIVERTQAGLQAAKRRGQKLGRPPSLMPEQITHARGLLDAGQQGRTVARIVGTSRATFYRAIKRRDNGEPMQTVTPTTNVRNSTISRHATHG